MISSSYLRAICEADARHRIFQTVSEQARKKVGTLSHRMIVIAVLLPLKASYDFASYSNIVRLRHTRP